MPMSASCVINRADLLTRLDEVRSALPGSLAQAQELLGGREQVVAQAQQEARRIIEAAHAERGSLVEGTEVVQQARAEAGRILAEARREAEEIRAEADDYVDSKLANFEVVLGKTIGSVDRGRAKLLGQGGDREVLLEEADAYVEAQFGAIEAVLRKTLEAVGRGRQKLTGHRPTDDLGEHFQDGRPGEESGPRAENYGQEQPAGTYYATPAPQPADEGYSYQEYAGYAPAGQPGYPAPGEGYGEPDPYGYAPAAQAQHPAQAQHHQARPAQPGYGGTLDETSLFDTGMIDAEQLRRYEQGR